MILPLILIIIVLILILIAFATIGFWGVLILVVLAVFCLVLFRFLIAKIFNPDPARLG
jgi:hypothetical protein